MSNRAHLVSLALALAAPTAAQVSHVHLSTVQTANQAGEITAFDEATGRYFVTNPASSALDVFSAASNGQLSFVTSVPMLGRPNSVAAFNGLVAVAVTGATPQAHGFVRFVDAQTASVTGPSVTVGPLPDMVVFTPDGQKVLTANEGQADEDTGLVNPEGSVSVVDVAARTAATASFAPWNSQKNQLQQAGVRLSDVNGITLAQDVEPEYIAIDAAGATAFVSLQENNAIAEIDIATTSVTSIRPLGTKDHDLPDNAFDPSNHDGITGNFQNFPVRGLFMPDALTTFTVDGVEYIATANEGDSRAPFEGFDDETRGAALAANFNLDSEDPTPDTGLYSSAELSTNAVLGRLKFATSDYDISRGDTDQDGDVDQLYSFGARSFSIWTRAGSLVFDSGDDLERAMLASGLWQESRSDDKGPEPEAITFGVVGGVPLLFVGLERTHAVLVYDVSDPTAPGLVDVIDVASESGVGARRPEGLAFIPGAANGTGQALLAVTSELDGALSLFAIQPDARATVIGVGCPSNQPLTLASNAPQLGATWTLAASSIESIAPLCLFWFGDGSVPVSVDLGPIIGATGCFLHTNAVLGAQVAAVTPAGTSTFSLLIPANPALLATDLSVQASARASHPTSNWGTANGIRAVVGN